MDEETRKQQHEAAAADHAATKPPGGGGGGGGGGDDIEQGEGEVYPPGDKNFNASGHQQELERNFVWNSYSSCGVFPVVGGPGLTSSYSSPWGNIEPSKHVRICHQHRKLLGDIRSHYCKSFFSFSLSRQVHSRYLAFFWRWHLLYTLN